MTIANTTNNSSYYFLLAYEDKAANGSAQWLKNVDTLQQTTNIEEAVRVAFPVTELGFASGDYQFVLKDSYIPGPRTILRDTTTAAGRLIDLPGFAVVPSWQLP